MAIPDTKLGKGKDAPQIHLALDMEYTGLIEKLVHSVIDVMRERNGGRDVHVINMCPEFKQICLRLSDYTGVASIGETRHLMQYGTFLQEAGLVSST